MRRWGNLWGGGGMRGGAFVRALVVTMLLVSSGAAKADELTAARAEHEQLEEQLQATVDELSALQSRTAVFEARRDEMAGELSRLQAELSGTQERLDDRIRRLYAHGVTSPAVMMLGAQSPTDAMERAAFAARLIRDDRATMEQVVAHRRQVDTVAMRLAREQRALDEATRRQQEVSSQLQRRLEEAAVTVGHLEEEQRLEEARRLEAQRVEEQRRLDEQRRHEEQRAREEAERRRVNEEQRRSGRPDVTRVPREAARIQPPPVSRPKPPPPPPPPPAGGGGNVGSAGGHACPLVRPRAFSNDWGAPRSGGRRHQGTDIFAPRGANVVAIVDGVVSLRGHGESAGWWLVLRGADGTSYWYMHLLRYTVANGTRVSAGQLIAQNGDTGNARGTSPHVHFEQHPGGGGAVNPYPMLKRVCG